MGLAVTAVGAVVKNKWVMDIGSGLLLGSMNAGATIVGLEQGMKKKHEHEVAKKAA